MHESIDKAAADSAVRASPATGLSETTNNASAGLQAAEVRGHLGGEQVQAAADMGLAGPAQRFPYQEPIQRAFGAHRLDGANAVVGGPAREACAALGAEAYTKGDRVGFAAQPDLHTAAHEAAHVVQQRAGVQVPGGMGQSGDRYEQNADAVADRVVRGQSAASLLGNPGTDASAGSSAVQLKGGFGKIKDAADKIKNATDKYDKGKKSAKGASAKRDAVSLANLMTVSNASIYQLPPGFDVKSQLGLILNHALVIGVDLPKAVKTGVVLDAMTLRVLQEFGVAKGQSAGGKTFKQWHAIIKKGITTGSPGWAKKPDAQGQVTLGISLASLPYLPPPPKHIVEKLVQAEVRQVVQTDITNKANFLNFYMKNRDMKSRLQAFWGATVAVRTQLFQQFVSKDPHKLFAKIEGQAVALARSQGLVSKIMQPKTQKSATARLHSLLINLATPLRGKFLTSLIQQGEPGWWVKLLAKMNSTKLPEHLMVESQVRKELAGRRPQEYFPTTPKEANKCKADAAKATPINHFFFRKEVRQKAGVVFKYVPVRQCGTDPHNVYFMIENRIFAQKKAYFKQDLKNAGKFKKPSDLKDMGDWLKDFYDKWNTPTDMFVQAYSKQILAQQNAILTAIKAITGQNMPKTAKLLMDNFPKISWKWTDLLNPLGSAKEKIAKLATGVRDHDKLGECAKNVAVILTGINAKKPTSAYTKLAAKSEYKDAIAELKANKAGQQKLGMLIGRISAGTNAVSLILNPQRRENVLKDLMRSEYFGQAKGNTASQVSDSYAVVRTAKGARRKWNAKQGTPPTGMFRARNGELVLTHRSQVLILSGKGKDVRVAPCTKDGIRLRIAGWESVYTRRSNLR